MIDFKVKIGAKEAVLDVQVIVLPLLSSVYSKINRLESASRTCLDGYRDGSNKLGCSELMMLDWV